MDHNSAESFNKSFEEFLQELSQKKQIICNDLVFKHKLKISPEAYKFLTKAENMESFISAISYAGGGAALTTGWWYLSASALTKFAIWMGIISLPLSVPVAGAVVGFGGVYFVKRLINKFREEAVEEIPRFTSTPIDLIAISVLDILMPAFIKVAYADRELKDEERSFIIERFTSKWGYCKDFLEKFLDFMIANQDLLNLKYEYLPILVNKINTIDPGLKKEHIVQNLILELEELALCDGSIDPKEQIEITKLREKLSK